METSNFVHEPILKDLSESKIKEYDYNEDSEILNNNILKSIQ